MKLTQQDIDMFKILSASDIGRWLVDYSNRLITYTCDVRNMKTGESSESVKKAADVIEINLINKITKVAHLKENDKSSFV